MLFKSLSAFAALLPATFACPHESHLYKRQQANQTIENPEWAYEASYNWHQVDPMYQLCQTGTQQSPIALSLSNGLSLNHLPTFHNYTGNTTGMWRNWGYGAAFTLSRDDLTSNPSFTYDNETAYLVGWHIHAPADHSVGGDRSKAEMHFVHADAEGHEKAVLAFRLDPGNSDAAFFSQLPPMIGFNETAVEYQQQAEMDLDLALSSVLHFNEFWTYQGSLTSPPCHEGIRWFVARQILFTGVKQMQAILGASTYSARAEQEVWQHRINE
ncbi:carbonic anhydrase [Aureobasidium sp. EXF-8845]|nr:carbonic anhydrase [Aureobasidium sp. EXF-8845]KAI4813479.1 carbonic anhydrase [Aureobasidium sp. EXF-8846]